MKRDTPQLSRPSIETDSFHHPTVKDKAHAVVQDFFLLIRIISLRLYSGVFRSIPEYSGVFLKNTADS
jgi:hypothetical protein